MVSAEQVAWAVLSIVGVGALAVSRVLDERDARLDSPGLGERVDASQAAERARALAPEASDSRSPRGAARGGTTRSPERMSYTSDRPGTLGERSSYPGDRGSHPGDRTSDAPGASSGGTRRAFDRSSLPPE